MFIDYATSLKTLKLYGMATAWSELQAEKPKQVHRPETWMERLLAAEQTDRKLKSLRHQLKAARFPIHRDLLDIDLDFPQYHRQISMSDFLLLKLNGALSSAFFSTDIDCITR